MYPHGFSVRHWQMIEAGRPITMITLLRVAEAFDLQPEDLLGGLAHHLRRLARRLQYFLDGDSALKTPIDLAERLGACGGGTISFLRFEEGKFTVSIPALIALYGRPELEQPVHIDPESDPEGDSGRTVLAITPPTPLEAITSDQQDRLIDQLLALITAALPRQKRRS
jgi:hypothetical protein